MKVALLFLMIACTAFINPPGRATATDDVKSSQQAKPPAREASRVAKTEKRSPKSIPLPKPVTPHRATNVPKGSLPRKPLNSRPQVSKQRNSPTNASLSASRATNNARSMRRSTVSRPAVSTPDDVRHHGVNPASIGGPRNTTVSSTAALNGRTVTRRP
jgi:hypothetical protein